MSEQIVQPRVVIADDNPRIRECISEIIHSHCRIVGKANDGPGAIEAVLRHLPDVALVDIFMPGLDGIQLAKRLCALHANCKIVMLTIVEDPDYVNAALEAGALSYVFKSRMVNDLLPAIHEAMAGRVFVSNHASREPRN